ncbi:MAG TPA: DUF559 domain-containing protein [Nocardioidaceae bacterium]|nr:DUF559 domain-containing protein [Nocardioidaceae bacterium]
MRAEHALERLGGVARADRLLQLTSRRRLRTALRRGMVRRDQQGRYSLPGVDEAVRVANRLSGILMEDSAAQCLGWELKHPPSSPCVAVPRNRKVDASRRRGVRVRYVDLDPDDVNGLTTSAVATVIWSAARMPFDEALALADSALRQGHVTREALVSRAARMPGRYRTRCLRVAELADARAANPFESVLRAIATEVEGLSVEPQVWVDGVGRPDLLDASLGLVVEADSFEFHGRRRALKRDCERYNALVVRGWLVLRFTWEHVMFEPDEVRAVLTAFVEGPSRRAVGGSMLRRSA